MSDHPAPSWLVGLALGALVLVVVVLLAAAVTWDKHGETIVHTYHGTTWIGDTCYVDSTGVLWCGPIG